MSIFYEHPSAADGLTQAQRDYARFEERMDYSPFNCAIKRELDGGENDGGNCSVRVRYVLPKCLSWMHEVIALRQLADAIQDRHIGATP